MLTLKEEKMNKDFWTEEEMEGEELLK